MNWEAIGAIGEVLGAIGVIVTLAYLAVQIRQNTRDIRCYIRALRSGSGAGSRGFPPVQPGGSGRASDAGWPWPGLLRFSRPARRLESTTIESRRPARVRLPCEDVRSDSTRRR